jgi:hypothetical protein
MEHYAANEPEMRALQEQANEYWDIRDPTRWNLEKVTEASDGQVAEAARSTDARSPSQMEAPTEPAKKVERRRIQRGHARETVGRRDVLEVVVHSSKKGERVAKRLARKKQKITRLLARDENFAGATEEELRVWARAYLDWENTDAWQAVIDYYQGLSASERFAPEQLSRQAMGRYGKALAHWGEGEYAAAYANAAAAGILQLGTDYYGHSPSETAANTAENIAISIVAGKLIGFAADKAKGLASPLFARLQNRFSAGMLWLRLTYGGPVGISLGRDALGTLGRSSVRGTLPAMPQSLADDLIASSQRLHKGGVLTTGEHALHKRLGKPGTAFAGIAPTQANVEATIRSILANPVVVTGGRQTMEVYNATGQGVRFDVGRNIFQTFLEGAKRTR